MKQHLPCFRLPSDHSDMLVTRDGIVICFFMRRSHGEVVHTVWRALQTYLRAIPPRALGWYPDYEGDFQPLDDKGWKHVRQEMFECRWPYQCSVKLVEHCDAVSDYSFEYQGHWLDTPWFNYENATCAVSFTLPTEYLVEHGPAHVRALALELARELPLCFGYASFALIGLGGLWTMARRSARVLRDRYPGLDIYNLSKTSQHIGTNARGAYWLTFLGHPLLGRLGGQENLRRQLPFPEVSLHTLPPLEGERVLITLSELPEVIDTAQGERPSPQLLALGRMLHHSLHEERSDWFVFLGLDLDDMHRWLHRFCP